MPFRKNSSVATPTHTDRRTIFKLDDNEYIFASICQTESTVLVIKPNEDGPELSIQTQCKKIINADEYEQPKDDILLERIEYYGIVGILDLMFGHYVFIVEDREIVTGQSPFRICKPTKIRVLQIRKPTSLSMNEETHEKWILNSIKDELLSTYYSHDLDLAYDNSGVILPSVVNGMERFCLNANLQNRFFWNQHILSPLLARRDAKLWALPLICGFAKSQPISVDGPPIDMYLISRINKHTAGAGYWMRGIYFCLMLGATIEGHASMEAETILMCTKDDLMASVCILRGSVPIIWSQHDLKDPFLDPQIRISSCSNSAKTLDNHVKLLKRYNCKLYALDMIDASDTKGSQLSLNYRSELSRVNPLLEIEYIHSDSIKNAKNLASFKEKMKFCSSNVGFFSGRLENDKVLTIKSQTGMVRVNSIDCADDVTIAEYYIINEQIPQMMIELNVWLASRDKLDYESDKIIKSMWAANGDFLCKYNLGTGMRSFSPFIKSNFLYRIVRATCITLSRVYQGHFILYKKQDVRDFMMGKLMFIKNFDTYGDYYEVVHPELSDYIYMRETVLRKEQVSNFPLNLILEIRRYTAPNDVETLMQFIRAMIWLVIYAVLVWIFRYPMEQISRKPKSFIPIYIPPIPDPDKVIGLNTYIEKRANGDMPEFKPYLAGQVMKVIEDARVTKLRAVAGIKSAIESNRVNHAQIERSNSNGALLPFMRRVDSVPLDKLELELEEKEIKPPQSPQFLPVPLVESPGSFLAGVRSATSTQFQIDESIESSKPQELNIIKPQFLAFRANSDGRVTLLDPDML